MTEKEQYIEECVKPIIKELASKMVMEVIREILKDEQTLKSFSEAIEKSNRNKSFITKIG